MRYGAVVCRVFFCDMKHSKHDTECFKPWITRQISLLYYISKEKMGRPPPEVVPVARVDRA